MTHFGMKETQFSTDLLVEHTPQLLDQKQQYLVDYESQADK